MKFLRQLINIDTMACNKTLFITKLTRNRFQLIEIVDEMQLSGRQKLQNICANCKYFVEIKTLLNEDNFIIQNSLKYQHTCSTVCPLVLTIIETSS